MNEPKKRILIVSHYYPPHVGGIEFVARDQALRLAEAGHAVAVVTSHLPRRDPEASTLSIVDVQRVPAWNGLEKFGVPFPIFSPSLVATLYRQVKRADVVHIHDAFYQTSFVAMVLAKLLKKPVVLTQHVSLVAHPNRLVTAGQDAVYRTSGRAIFAASKTILVLNDNVKRFLLDRRVDAAKIQAAINGTDTGLFHPANSDEKRALRQKYGLPEKPLVLFVGRLVPKKGFDKVLAIKDTGYHLVFAGGTSQDPAFKQLGVTLLGALPQADLAEVYRTADVFVLPSEGEGFPLSIQEAMASGLPVVTSYDNGYDRYALDRTLVRMLNTPSPDTLKSTIQEILTDQELRTRMSTYARAYALENFSWSTRIKHLESIYAQVKSRSQPHE